MPDQTYSYKPPLSWISNTETRTLGFHGYQIFEILRGSGLTSSMPAYNLDVVISSGSGPLYNIQLTYGSATVSGLSNIAIGDKLIIGDDVNNLAGGAKQWYRYDITAINSSSASSASVTVKYILDTASGGDTSPENLHYDYDSYGNAIDLNIIARETNTNILTILG
jgi:hypothetical protein